MNDESLNRANAFLAAIASRLPVGEIMTETPAEVGRDLGFPDALSTARAMRALISRGRLEPTHGSYRLLDDRPLDPAEREQGGTRRARRRPEPRPASGGVAYGEFGRAVVDRLVELGTENATLRAEIRQAREDLREARGARDDAERNLRSLRERIGTLENRAEMAEANVRAILATAKGQGTRGDEPVGDAEMAAILGVLRNEADEDDATVVVDVVAAEIATGSGSAPATTDEVAAETT
jgi:hypothetical protein